MAALDPASTPGSAAAPDADGEAATIALPAAAVAASRPGAAWSGPMAPAAASVGAPGPDGGLPEAGSSLLLALANKVLLALPQVRHTRAVDDVAALRNRLAQGIRAFATEASARGIAPERIMAARYLLCTAFDEAAAATPWGGQGQWQPHSLLAAFHNDTQGGEKVFQLMARLADDPGANRDLLELIYAALALGFKGRYAALPDGEDQLDTLRAKLATLLTHGQPADAVELAPHWEGTPRPRRRLLNPMPLATAAVLCALLVGAAYAGLAWNLNAASDQVLRQLLVWRVPGPPTATAAVPGVPRLAPLLQAEVDAGALGVRDEAARSVVTLAADGLFAPDGTALLPAGERLLARVAAALAALPGPVLVSGHTDGEPLPSARFPSRWHLSQERAERVADALRAAGVDGARLRAEGRADAEPLVAPADAAAQARNRRIEIVLTAAAAPRP